MEQFTPSGRELEILKVLWEVGPASVREVHRRLCPNDELAFNTVQTLLRIMDGKGLVSHKRRGRTFVYTPRYSRQRATARFLDQVFDGAIDQVVVSMLTQQTPAARNCGSWNGSFRQPAATNSGNGNRKRSLEMPGDCPNFRGATDAIPVTRIATTKMGLSPSDCQ